MAESLNILIVEDDENDLLLLQIAFFKAEWQGIIAVVKDGLGAIGYLSGDPPYDDRKRNPAPAILLLDLKLPRCSGFEVLEWLRLRPELRPQFVVVFTASDYPVDIRRTRALGADAHIIKPHDLRELVGLVEGLKSCRSGSRRVALLPGAFPPANGPVKEA